MRGCLEPGKEVLSLITGVNYVTQNNSLRIPESHKNKLLQEILCNTPTVRPVPFRISIHQSLQRCLAAGRIRWYASKKLLSLDLIATYDWSTSSSSFAE